MAVSCEGVVLCRIFVVRMAMGNNTSVAVYVKMEVYTRIVGSCNESKTE